jgi:hypothetical protein
MFDTEDDEEEEEDSPTMKTPRTARIARAIRRMSSSDSDSDDNALVFSRDRVLDEVPEQVLEAEMRIARDFSPLGERLPRDFEDWFKIKNTPTYGGPLSRGVFATRDIADGTFLGEYRGVIYHENRRELDSPQRAYGLRLLQNGRYLHTIVADDRATSSWVRLVNAPRYGERANSVFVQAEDENGNVRAFLQASRPISRGEQILVDYRLADDRPSRVRRVRE